MAYMNFIVRETLALFQLKRKISDIVLLFKVLMF